MSVISENCPRCGGNVHAESFVGHVGNRQAYTKRICIGDKGTEGTDGAFYTNRGTGCGFRARKTWNSENKAETMETNDAWDEWEQHHA